MNMRPKRYFYDNEIISAMDIVDLYLRLFNEKLDEEQQRAFVVVYNTFVDELIERDVIIE